MMSHWMFNCKEVTQLVSESLDRELPLYRRFLIRMHLYMCKYCLRFEKQLRIIRNISRNQELQDSTLDQSVVLPPEAYERIKHSIKSTPQPS
jgi:hypothetical protein